MAVIRDGQHRGSTFVEGWRDQECPLCGAKYFTDARQHVSLAHGIRPSRTSPGGVSEAKRLMTADHVRDSASIQAQRRARKATQRRWAKAVEAERAKGLYGYVNRLCLRWQVGKPTAYARIRSLTALGLIEATPKAFEILGSATECIHGHAFTPENTAVSRRGERCCLACRRDSARRQYRTEATRRRGREYQRRKRANVKGDAGSDKARGLTVSPSR